MTIALRPGDVGNAGPLYESGAFKGGNTVGILKIRDFIYLDTERLKSIIAQIEQGLVNTSNQLKMDSQEGTASVEGSILGFLKGVGGAKFIWQNQATETKTLHDNIYNKVEDALISSELLIRIPDKFEAEDIISTEFRNMLSDTSFILARGRININDFTQMRLMLEKFNDLGKFIAQCSVLNLPGDTPKHLKSQLLKKAQDEVTLDKNMLNGFKLIFDTFYKDRVVIKMMPFIENADFRLVGNINKAFLRDDISSITYKYGTAPVSEWTIFAQIAAIPPKDRSNVAQNIGGAQIEVALQNMFNSFRDIEVMAQSVVYPEIAITPIAVYRE